MTRPILLFLALSAFAQIRTAQIRDLIQLYAMSTGQQTKGMPAQD